MSVGQLESDLRRRNDFVKVVGKAVEGLNEERKVWELSEGKEVEVKKSRKKLLRGVDLKKNRYSGSPQVMKGKGRRVRIRNRCVLSSRGRGVLRKFQRARMEVRLAARNGCRSGVRKASW